MTRKLTIRTKLAAALAVPLVAFATFAAFQVRDSYDTERESHRQSDLATAATGPGDLVGALKRERTFEALRAMGAEQTVDVGPNTSKAAQNATDDAVENFRTRLSHLDPTAADLYAPPVASISAGIMNLRERVDTLAAGAGPANAADANEVFADYTTLVNGLLDANQRVPLQIDDARLRNGVELLDAINRLDDVEAQLVYQAATASVTQSPSAIVVTGGLLAVQRAGEQRVRTLATRDYRGPVLDVLDRDSRRAFVTALPAVVTTSSAASSDLDTLLAAVPQGNERLNAAGSDVANVVFERARALRHDAQTKERQYAALAVGSVLLAILVLVLANRWITRPLRRLADEARTMATDRVPAAVNAILETPVG